MHTYVLKYVSAISGSHVYEEVQATSPADAVSRFRSAHSGPLQDRLLGLFESKPVPQDGDRADYGPEAVLRLDSGVTVCTEPYSANLGGVSYVRVCDEDGQEIGYWDHAEWRDDPQGVMGAIVGAALMRGS
jgi:hypothetical protein